MEDTDRSRPAVNGDDVDCSTRCDVLNKLDYLRFTFADIHGIPRSKVVANRNFDKFLKEGITVFGVSVALGPRNEIVPLKDFTEIRFGNAAVMPVSGTLRELPWATDGKYRVGEVLCETFWTPPYRDGAKQGACTRHVAERQLERLSRYGYQLYSSFEAECVVFKHGTMTPVFGEHGFCSNLIMSEFESFMCEVDDNISKSGVDLETLQLEYSPGQFEFVTKPTYGIQAADKMFCLTEGIKEISLLHNWDATFMTQPIPGDTANACHFNHSLWRKDTNQNAFYDASTPDRLSAVAKHWIAGLLKHSAALTALCNPTVNCYRRLHQPWAPGKADWAIDDRQASFRCKNLGPGSTYVENRIPGGSSNPYLVLAATVAAGLDGVVNSLECPPPRSDGKDGANIPVSLADALIALEGDEAIASALGDEFMSCFLTVKRETEVDKLAGKDDINLEREMYFKLF